MQIRLSKREDAASMIELEHLVWTPGTTPGNIHFDSEADFLLKCPPGSKIVVANEDKVVGILGYKSPIPLASNQHVVEIDIAVHPDFQRAGIGQILMDKMKEVAREKGYIKISLRVLSINKKAIHFYEKNGFKQEGFLEKEFIIQGEFVDDILMAYFL
ncbi:GNAT family N-acetyltransferase [Listeria cossartiae subsp. cayugensis]|uniref:GNAT family N-acetyltransferase n=1 Tax=Listeria cossartiae TaxID=2838249 RepID=UPI00288023B1|nr:GNAT family N-acetyltransferase [Listeria cossartiae]MDT0000450.1 GNAT family N-acetyltransferase [Listeria cossartiae subsp. cayugensis]MDT0008462.1 GNAT family N-acetyltransferase [Listeria cossartiae subsp. cayugensis]MDT0030294.1 GNAT family N-acetyltransferase [Listeria cossartiae subsp. cayugensis]MDT0038596.1 GNAT family N-acetyltransferase [Listeria cossartiae subsp. cayugensis]MDT0043947.1 GNAT family N-acetyltransferase [Listeria cossartiae subsp. cayugensis]